MQTSIFVLACTAIFGALASPAPSVMGVEVTERDGQTFVREVVRSLDARACTNCVHVGGQCLIGEGNCYSTEHAYCTACGNKGSICVSTAGSCDNP